MRILVTGAAGQLGGDVVEALRDRGHTPLTHTRVDGDLSTPGVASAALARHRPDAVVNCAAWTQVDRAESETESAFLANATAPRLVAVACAEARARLCHISTDFVFDGVADAPIPESRTPHPLGVYGASKLAGEEAVRDALAGAQIVRTAWLFGRGGPNFVMTMLRLGREGRELRVVDDQRGSPTWTAHLAPALVRLVERQTPGTYHIVNSGEASWHDVAVAALEAAGIREVRVERITTEEYPTPARRPPYSVLATGAWQALGEPPLPPWREAVAGYVALLGARLPT